MLKSYRFAWLAACVLMTASLSGCGTETDPRSTHVSGTVTYKGAPVPRGDIQFRPTADNTGPPGFAHIVDGKYNTAESGKGVVGGAYTVMITGYDGKAKPEAELPMGASLFPEYKATVDIPPGAAIVKDFNVQLHSD
jgi:hypothetical protein